MITWFPTFYPDELLYSLLARFRCRSGYLTYRDAARELFENPAVKPSVELISPMTQQASALVSARMPMAEVIGKHTMFAAYARFLSAQRRSAALTAMLAYDPGAHNHLCMPKSRSVHVLRYCPQCAQQDRLQYGETYWHRIHQIQRVDVCAKHHCYLEESCVGLTSAGSPSLIAAEQVVSQHAPIRRCEDALLCRVAEYVCAVFEAELYAREDGSVSALLHRAMTERLGFSLSNGTRDMEGIYTAFCQYYANTPHEPLDAAWKLQKLLCDRRHAISDVCLFALFLGLTPQELTAPVSAEATGVKRKRRERGSDAKRCGAPALDYAAMDAELLPVLQQLIDRSLYDDTQRPQRISVGMAERLLGLPDKRLANCPRCLALIRQHCISQEEFWAKEMVWAARTLRQNGRSVTVTGLLKLTNIRRDGMQRGLPFLSRYTDENSARMIADAVGGKG